MRGNAEGGKLMRGVLAVLFCGIAFAAKKSPVVDPTAPKVRVFVADSETWKASSFNAAGVSGKAGSALGVTQAGQSKFTTAVMAQLYKQCPSVMVVNKEDTAEYFVRVEQDLTIWSQHQNLAVFNKSGEMVFAASAGLVSRDVKKLCELPAFGGSKKK